MPPTPRGSSRSLDDDSKANQNEDVKVKYQSELIGNNTDLDDDEIRDTACWSTGRLRTATGE